MPESVAEWRRQESGIRCHAEPCVTALIATLVGRLISRRLGDFVASLLKSGLVAIFRTKVMEAFTGAVLALERPTLAHFNLWLDQTADSLRVGINARFSETTADDETAVAACGQNKSNRAGQIAVLETWRQALSTATDVYVVPESAFDHLAAVSADEVAQNLSAAEQLDRAAALAAAQIRRTDQHLDCMQRRLESTEIPDGATKRESLRRFRRSQVTLLRSLRTRSGIAKNLGISSMEPA